MRDRQHDDGERHEHHGQEEVVQEAEEPLVHVPGHRICHERVRQQCQADGHHGDDRRVERRLRIVDVVPRIGEVMPFPSGRQAERAGLGRRLQRGDDREVQRDEDGQREHGHDRGQPPVNLMILAEPLALGVPLRRLGRLRCAGHQICSLPLKNFNWMNARMARTMKNVTALAIW